MRRLRSLDTYIVILGAVALILVGPLRPAFVLFPLVLFLGTLFLFMVPGVVVLLWFFDEHLSGLVMVPLAFALSVGVFGLLGVPFLVLHRSLELYLWAAGAIVAASLAAAAFDIFRRKPSVEKGMAADSFFDWLWVPFLLLSVALALVSWVKTPSPYEDLWVYLADVREFLSADKLALYEPYFGNETGTSRLLINGWLLEQAALSRISGVDPVVLVVDYLSPTLIVMSLLAFYALARVLLKSETAALFVGSLYAMALLGPLSFEKISWSATRIAEDKFTAWLLFLPVALVFAFLFLESQKLRYLMVFASLCWAVVTVHPVGLAIIGLSAAGLGFLHLAVNWRKREAWIRTASLGSALLSVLLAPVLYLLATGDSLVAVLKSADINSGDPDVLANMVFVRWKGRLLELGANYYVVPPSRLLNPAILVAFLVGLPFLLWRLKRSLAAQLLVGMLLVPTIVCFVPPVATFFGEHVVLPGQMWRLTWPIPLAVLLIIGWIVWETMRYAQIGLNKLGFVPRVTRLLPLALVGAIVVAAAPSFVDSEAKAISKTVYRASEGTQNSGGQCFDPIFRWMRDHIEKPSVVLAPDNINTCIPAYSAQANVVSLRGRPVLRNLAALERRAPGKIDVPQGALDVQRFFSGTIRPKALEIIRRHEVDYVMASPNSRLDGQLKRWPGYTAVDTPGEKQSLYAVDRSKLGGSAEAQP